jgi:hypothetical protein
MVVNLSLLALTRGINRPPNVVQDRIVGDCRDNSLVVETTSMMRTSHIPLQNFHKVVAHDSKD